MNKYQEILDLFVSKDQLRDWMTRPFIINNKIFATNGWALVSFNLTNLKVLGDVGYYKEDKLNMIYPFEPNLDNTYSIDYLKECFKSVPLVEDYDEEVKESLCDECDNSGVVTFTYIDSKCKDHELNGECPICDGMGKISHSIKKPNGKMIEDPDSKCRIGNSLFFANKIKHILEVAELLGVNEFKHIYQGTPVEKNLFKIGDVELLLMPTMSGGDFNPDSYAFNIA